MESEFIALAAAGKEANTHFDQSIKLGENMGRAIAQLEFAIAIGSMMYAMRCT